MEESSLSLTDVVNPDQAIHGRNYRSHEGHSGAFDEDVNEIQIVGNKSLSDLLLDIADVQSNRIIQANKGVVKAIKNLFHGVNE